MTTSEGTGTPTQPAPLNGEQASGQRTASGGQESATLIPEKHGWFKAGQVEDGRIVFGGVIILAAPAGVTYLAVTAGRALPSFEDLGFLENEMALLAAALLATHAVIAVAGVFFFYQMLRVGERLAMPLYVLRPERLLGVTTPISEMRRTTRWVLARLKEVLEALPGKKEG